MFTNREVAFDYIKRVARERPDWYADGAFWGAKLSEEAGEAVKEENRRVGFSRSPYDPAHAAEELADVVISAYAVALMAGIDLDTAIQAKHTVLMTRDLKGT